MTGWDPFAQLRPKRPEDRRDEEASIGGKADGAAGGHGFPQRKSMNERIRDANDEMKRKGG